MDRKANFRLIVYSHSSTKRENLAKIFLVDVEIIGLKRIYKNKSSSERAVHQPGGLKIHGAAMHNSVNRLVHNSLLRRVSEVRERRRYRKSVSGYTPHKK